MVFREGTVEDIDEIMELIREAIVLMDSMGIHQWDELYPCRQDLISDLGNLFVGEEDGRIAVIFVINRECDEQYFDYEWEYENWFIIHRLCVHPDFQNRGIAKEAVMKAYDVVRQRGGDSLRLDAFSKNPYALRLYEKLGFKTRGYADLRMGRFVLMEKGIE